MGKLRDWLSGSGATEERADVLGWRGGYPSASTLGAISLESTGGTQPLAVPTVFRCIELLTTTIAQFPAGAHTEATGAKIATPRVLQRPDPTSTYRQFIMDTVMDMLWCGGATWQISARSPTGQAITLRRIDFSLVRWRWNPAVPQQQAILAGDRICYIGAAPAPNQTDFIYLPMILRPGSAEGVGPIQAGAEQIEGALIADAQVKSNFDEGVYPSGVVEIEGHMTAGAADALSDKFITKHAGSRAPVIMTGGAKYNAIQATAQQMQWIEARGYNTNEIARLFGVPAALLNVATMGGSGTVTYQNQVSVRNAFLGNGLSPLIMRIEDAFAMACLSSTQTCHLDTTHYLSPLPAAGPQFDGPNPDGEPIDVQAQADEATGVDVTPSRGNTRVT